MVTKRLIQPSTIPASSAPTTTLILLASAHTGHSGHPSPGGAGAAGAGAGYSPGWAGQGTGCGQAGTGGQVSEPQGWQVNEGQAGAVGHLLK